MTAFIKAKEVIVEPPPVRPPDEIVNKVETMLDLQIIRVSGSNIKMYDGGFEIPDNRLKTPDSYHILSVPGSQNHINNWFSKMSKLVGGELVECDRHGVHCAIIRDGQMICVRQEMRISIVRGQYNNMIPTLSENKVKKKIVKIRPKVGKSIVQENKERDKLAKVKKKKK